MSLMGKIIGFALGTNHPKETTSPVIYTGEALDAISEAGAVFRDNVDTEAMRLARIENSYGESGRLLITEEHILEAFGGCWTFEQEDLTERLERKIGKR